MKSPVTPSMLDISKRIDKSPAACPRYAQQASVFARRLLTIDQGGRVDPDGEALLGYFQIRRDVGYQDRDDQQVIAAYEVEAVRCSVRGRPSISTPRWMPPPFSPTAALVSGM